MVRVVTGLLIAIAFGLLLLFPFSLRNRPHRSAPLPVRRAYLSQLAWHTGGLVVVLVGAGVGAVLIVRQARAEYRAEAMRNLRTLIEGKEPVEGKDPGA